MSIAKQCLQTKEMYCHRLSETIGWILFSGLPQLAGNSGGGCHPRGRKEGRKG